MSVIQIIAMGLLVTGGAGVLWQKFRGTGKTIEQIVAPVLAPSDDTRSSDKPAPTGVQEYLKLIALTAPSANEKIWWEYALAELTECQVLRAEVSRLAPKVQPVESAKPEVKV